MASGKKLTINGYLTANGSSSNRIVFQSSSGTWYGIEINYFYPWTALTYCTIQNASYAARAYHTTLNIDHCIFTGNGVGIKYDNQSGGYVQNSTISSCTNNGIECSQNSNPTIRPYNRIWNNVAAGVTGDGNSLPELGTLWNYGNNSIKDNYPDEIWSTNSNTVYAQYNYWDSSTPDPYVSPNVVWEPYLTSDPTGGGLLKQLAETEIPSPSQSNANADTSGKSEFSKAYQTYLHEDYTNAISLFEEIVNKYPDSPAGLQALALTDHCYQNLDNRAASLSYLNQVADTYKGKEISGLASSISVGQLVRNGAYDEAISTSLKILDGYADKNLGKYALYDLGTIYWYYLEDRETGEKYYRQLITQWPKDDLAASAMATLGEWTPGAQSPNPDSSQALAKLLAIPTEYGLSQNFPNPFNPRTEIQYQLPEASRLTLKIYNVLGQRIVTLIDEQQPAGYYTVIWDGRNALGEKVGAGIYLCRMLAGEFVKTQKMTLLP